MPLLLNIDTATEVASVCITQNTACLAFRENRFQKEHASFLHPAIESILKESGVQLADLDALAITAGPGSYTGLRVAMAAAKGFCYPLGKPLITLNTLEVMAHAALQSLNLDADALLAPMIDARRMEVFTALYDRNLQIIERPGAIILEKESFDNYLAERKIVFFGSGSSKFSELKANKNAFFESVVFSAKNLGVLAEDAFKQEKFADVSYSEPDYLKDFHLMSKR